ncbi:hypothetical protein [Thermocatellispora tengchongensis]|uniref:hypothetical protein n=1 Tax=Thermocatellispora tengchongensis TaxID=1073253 RepID=UPI00336F78E8
MTAELTNDRSYTTSVWVRSQSGTPSAKARARRSWDDRRMRHDPGAEERSPWRGARCEGGVSA